MYKNIDMTKTGILLKITRKKQLTGKVPYNIITQCDVVRDTLANSPGDGIYQRFRTFPHF